MQSIRKKSVCIIHCPCYASAKYMYKLALHRTDWHVFMGVCPQQQSGIRIIDTCALLYCWK